MTARRFAVTFFVWVSLAVWPSIETFAMDLTQFKWKNRLLFIFAENASNPPFKDIKNQVAFQKAEVDDRDLIVFEVPAKGPARMNNKPLSRKDTDSIRNHFALAGDTFCLILVGKDGGIKLKRIDQVDLTEVFDLIDAMPMRQGEMERKSK